MQVKANLTQHYIQQSLLGFISALPQWPICVLPIWFSDLNMSAMWTGMLGVLVFPYLLKWLWAPVLDYWTQRAPVVSLLRLLQIMVVVMMFMAVLFAHWHQWFLVIVMSLVMAFLSASFDTLLDGYRLQIEDEQLRTQANSAGILGYRLGLALVMIVPTMWVANQWSGWEVPLVGIIVVYALCCFVYGMLPMGTKTIAHHQGGLQDIWFNIRSFSWLFWVYLWLFKAPLYLLEQFMYQYLKQQAHFSLVDIAFWQQSVGLCLVFLGVGVMPVIMTLFRTRQVMLGLSMAQSVIMLSWWQLSSHVFFGGAVVLICAEHLLWGMMNVFLVSWLMSLCQAQFRMTQYALFVAFSLLPKFMLSMPLSYVIEYHSWQLFFAICCLLSLALSGLLLRRSWCKKWIFVG